MHIRTAMGNLMVRPLFRPRAATLACAMLILLPGLAHLAAGEAQALPVSIGPHDKRIRYIGRFDMSDSKKARFAWAGSSFVFRFKGTAVNLVFRDGMNNGKCDKGGYWNNYVNVVIDDKKPKALPLRHEKYQGVLRVAEGLADKAHTVTVFRRTGPRFNPVDLFGLQLNRGGKMLEPPPKKKRCLEVVGDSISVGYGIMGENKRSPAIPFTENCYLTYGALAARELDADFVCIAWSGYGIYRDLKGRKENTMPILYERTLPHDKKSRWDFRGYTPDVVVINLGTNDFSPGIPEKAEFNKAYRVFVERIWKAAPEAHIFCTTSPMTSQAKADIQEAYLKALKEALVKEGRKNLHVIRFPSQHTIPDGLGGQWHPSVKTHEAMADMLVKAVKMELGW